MPAFSWERRVEFCETDAAGIAHFSSLATYMEQAEHALFRSIGLTVFPRGSTTTPSGQWDDEHNVTWPRVHVSMDFEGPALFEDLLRIDVVVAKIGTSSVTFEHKIHCQSRPVALGKSISVCCKIDRTGSHQLLKQSIPESIRERLSRYV